MKTKQNNTPDTAFNKALKFLSYRQRSTKEVYDYLKKKEYSEESINETIQKLNEYKFLNDEEFARTFTNSRQIKGKSKRTIAFELKLRGINRETAEQTLDSSQDDLKTAKEYIEKRIHQFENLEPEKRKKRIISRLQARGYSWDVIKKLLEKINTTS